MEKDKERERRYERLIRRYRAGESLGSIAKVEKVNLQNMRKQLRKRLRNEFDDLAYGKLIKKYPEYEIRDIPLTHTASNESDITKKAKLILKSEHNLIDEVGVWMNDKKTRYAVDLYDANKDVAYELYWNSGETAKKLIAKIRRFEKYFSKVIVVLLSSSEWVLKRRTYPLIKQKLEAEKINYIILDVATTNRHGVISYGTQRR